ncbi:MAG: 50S ribosomal protein L18 [Ignavibacteriales bacterium]|nr:50S ribosomal protein L18 [Ignavibacteriales bacterium]
MIKKSRIEQRLRIKGRVQKKIRGTAERPRLTIYCSLHHVYAQVVDDTQSKTLVAASSNSPDLRDELKGVKGMIGVAKRVGMLVAKKAIEKNVKQVVFDRNGYLYHGIVKSMADGAREAGLKF